MKKLLTLFTFVFICQLAGAQLVTTHNTTNDKMRIFVKDGEEILTAFPSKYLKSNVKIANVKGTSVDLSWNNISEDSDVDIKKALE